MTSDIRKKIIDSLDDSDHFESKFDKLISIQLVIMFLDKFEFEKFYCQDDFTYKEYKHYFKPIIKKHFPWLHKDIKKTIQGEKR